MTTIAERYSSFRSTPRVGVLVISNALTRHHTRPEIVAEAKREAGRYGFADVRIVWTGHIPVPAKAAHARRYWRRR